MASSFLKLILVVACVNLFLYSAGVRVIGEDAPSFVQGFVNESSGSYYVSPDLQGRLPSTLQESGSSTLSFIDALASIQNFLSFIINIVFTPLGLLTGAGFPSQIVLLVGVPVMIMLFITVGMFIRGLT